MLVRIGPLKAVLRNSAPMVTNVVAESPGARVVHRRQPVEISALSHVRQQNRRSPTDPRGPGAGPDAFANVRKFVVHPCRPRPGRPR